MTARYSNTLRDQNQVPIPGALVTVTDLSGNPVSLTNNDGSALPNPFSTDGFGGIVFNTVAAGFYTLDYHYGGRRLGTDRNVTVGVPAVDPALTSLALSTGAGFVGANDGSGGSLYTTVQGFIAKLLSSTGSSLIGFLQAGTGAVARTAQARLRESVSVKDFGAACDGATDDSAAVQAAVNYCLSFANPKALIVPGQCRLASSVNIDRLVDSRADEFIIRGQGDAAGFHTTGNVTMFDSTLTVTTSPQSERIEFENIRFSTSVVGNTSYVLSKKFLRVGFEGCFFSLIRCITSNIFVQSLWFQRCTMLYTAADFVSGAGSYDITFLNCEMKGGGTIFKSLDATYGTTGLKFIGNLVEGLQDSTIKITGAAGVTISSNHIEGNSGDPDFNFFAGTIDGKAAVITGNYIVRAAGSSFYFGVMDGVFSAGNYQSGGTLHTGVANAKLVSIGDSCPTIADVPLMENAQGLKVKATVPVAITYSASMTPVATAGNAQVITATNGTAFTINAPTNSVTGQTLTFTIRNTSGGVLGAVTWNAVFKLATWTSPATANSRSISFRYDGTNWIEIGRTPADVPN